MPDPKPPRPSYASLQQRLLELENEVWKHRKVEVALRKSEETYRLVSETAAEMILLCDPEWRTVYVNPAGCSLSGFSKEDMLGKRIQRFLDPPEASDGCALDALGQSARKGGPTEVVFRLRNGGALPAEVMVTPVTGKRGPRGFLITARDISHRKGVEKARLQAQKLESIGVLAGGIAHDYNNLLTAVMGYLALAESLLDADEEAATLLGRARQAADMAKHLSKRLMTFAQGGRPAQEAQDIGPLLEKTLTFSLAGSGIRWDLQIPPDLRPAWFDASQLAHAVHNIVNNAREAMPGGGSLHLRAENLRIEKGHAHPVEPGDWVHVILRDEGAGIPKAHVGRIFDPYFTTKEMGAKKGLGLGLAISHSIVRNHGGALIVESQPDRGAAFHLYLPAAIPDAGEQPSDRPSAVGTPRPC